MVIDATELGDLLPLAGAEYRVGAEAMAETGEAHAQPHEAKAHCVQSFTYTFAAERRPAAERHVIPEPAKYRHYREARRMERVEVEILRGFGYQNPYLRVVTSRA